MSAGRPSMYLSTIVGLVVGETVVIPWQFEPGSQGPVNARSVSSQVSKVRRTYKRQFEIQGTPVGLLVRRTS